MMAVPAPVMSYDEKSHVTSDFDCLDLRNVMGLWTMLLALPDAGTGTTTKEDMLHPILIV